MLRAGQWHVSGVGVEYPANLMNLSGTPPPDAQTLATFSLTTYLLLIGIAFWLGRKRGVQEGDLWSLKHDDQAAAALVVASVIGGKRGFIDLVRLLGR
jgi:hypothetical protein